MAELVLESERLLLRPFGPRDVEPHIALMQRPAVAKFLRPQGKTGTRIEEWRLAAALVGHWSIRGFGFFALTEKASGDWVGRVGPYFPEGWPQVECGWTIHDAHWGKGFAAEAAITTINWLFEQQPGLERIISAIAPSNAHSQAVARKIGEQKTDERFSYVGIDLEVWACTRQDWMVRHG